MQKRLYTFVLVLILILLGNPLRAHALSVTPIRLEISGNPGETLNEQMTLFNESKDQQVFYASFANFEAQGDSGSPMFTTPTDDLGTWITTDQSTVNLAPGEQKVMPFQITIPSDALPGGHFAAIFWGTNAGAGATPGQVSIGTKTGMLILLSVSGDVKIAAGVSGFQTHNNQHFFKELPVGFQYEFSNQGGDREKPVGDIVVRSILGWRVKKVDANPFDGNVLPGTIRKFTAEWVKTDSVDTRDKELAANNKYSFMGAVKEEWQNFALGIFRAKLQAQYGSDEQSITSASVYFVVFPPELMLIIIVGALLAFFILRTFIRRYNRSIIRKAQAHHKG
jgi:hypothetical protein